MSGFSKVVKVMNASERALAIVQSEFRDYHPLISLARLAHDSRVQEDPKLELEVHKAILPYVAPKLANVEVKAEEGDAQRRVVVTLFDDRQIEDGRTVPVEIPLEVDARELVPLDS